MGRSVTHTSLLDFHHSCRNESQCTCPLCPGTNHGSPGQSIWARAYNSPCPKGPCSSRDMQRYIWYRFTLFVSSGHMMSTTLSARPDTAGRHMVSSGSGGSRTSPPVAPEVSPRPGSHPTREPLGTCSLKNSPPTCRSLSSYLLPPVLPSSLDCAGWHAWSWLPPHQELQLKEKTAGSFCHGQQGQLVTASEVGPFQDLTWNGFHGTHSRNSWNHSRNFLECGIYMFANYTSFQHPESIPSLGIKCRIWTVFHPPILIPTHQSWFQLLISIPKPASQTNFRNRIQLIIRIQHTTPILSPWNWFQEKLTSQSSSRIQSNL